MCLMLAQHTNHEDGVAIQLEKMLADGLFLVSDA